jgi:hypothetical protein
VIILVRVIRLARYFRRYNRLAALTHNLLSKYFNVNQRLALNRISAVDYGGNINLRQILYLAAA